VSVDGLPWHPGLGEPKKEYGHVKKLSTGIKTVYSRMTPEHWKHACMGTIMSQMNNPTAWRPICQEAQRSIPSAVGQVSAELMQIDLRPLIRKIKHNVLVFVPSGFGADDAAAIQIEKDYAAQFASAKSVRFVSMRNSLHFVMQDEEQRFLEELRTYLKTRK
jgi:hypothetical protein